MKKNIETTSVSLRTIMEFIDREREEGWDAAASEFPDFVQALLENELLFARYRFQKLAYVEPYRKFFGEEDQIEEAKHLIETLKSSAPEMNKFCYYRYNPFLNEYELILLEGVRQRWFMFNTTQYVSKLWIDEYRRATSPHTFTYGPSATPFAKREKIRCGVRYFISDSRSDSIPTGILFLNSTTRRSLTGTEVEKLNTLVENLTQQFLSLNGRDVRSKEKYGVLARASRSFYKIESLKSLAGSFRSLTEQIEEYFEHKQLTVPVLLYRYVNYADLLEVFAGPRPLMEKKYVPMQRDFLEALALETQKVLLIEDATDFVEFYREEENREIQVDFESGIVIPFTIDEDQALLVVGASEKDAFCQEDVQFLRDLTTIVSSSVEKHRESQYKHQLSRFNQISETLVNMDRRRPDDLGPLMNKLSEQILEISGAHMVSICLCDDYQYEKGSDFKQSSPDIGHCKIVEIDDWRPSERGYSWWIVNHLQGLLIQYRSNGATSELCEDTEQWIVDIQTNSIRRGDTNEDELTREGGTRARAEKVLTQLGLPLFHGPTVFGILWISFMGRRHYLDSSQIQSFRVNRQYRIEVRENEYFSRHDLSILSLLARTASFAIYQLTEERRRLKSQFDNESIKFLLKNPTHKRLTTYDRIVALRADIIATSKVIDYLTRRRLKEPIKVFTKFIEEFVEEMGKTAIEAGAIVISNEDHIMGVWTLPRDRGRKSLHPRRSQDQPGPEFSAAIECGLRMQDIYNRLRTRLIRQIGSNGIPWKDLLKLFISIDYDPKSTIIAGFTSTKIMSRFTALGATIASVSAMQRIPHPKGGIYVRSLLRSFLQKDYRLTPDVGTYTNISQDQENLDRINERKRRINRNIKTIHPSRH